MLDLGRFKVLELSTGISTPLCGTALANLGAEVIKVESSRKLDLNRARAAPPNWAYEDMTECFLQFHEVNAGKKSIRLNLKQPQGKDLLLRYVAECDVAIQNFAPGWLERLGLSADHFFDANPGLVMVFLSAYGQEGPLRAQRAYAPIMSALGGLESIVGYEGEEPVGVLATALGDPNGSYFSLLLTLAGLYRRERTGEGALVDLSCTEAITALLGEAVLGWQATGERPRLRGVHREDAAPHGVYAARGHDRWVAVTVETDGQWAALAEVVGGSSGSSLWADPSLRDVGARLARQLEIDEALASWTVTRDADEASETLQAHGIPAAPVLSAADLDQHDHFVERGLLHRVHHQVLGDIAITGTPWRVDGEAPRVHGAGPLFGHDTETVLGQLLGIEGQELEALRLAGVLE